MFKFWISLMMASLCFESPGVASENSLLDLSYINHPGQFSASFLNVNSESGLSGFVSGSTVNTYANQSLLALEAKLGIFKDFAISAGAATGTNKLRTAVDSTEVKQNSAGATDPFVGFSWRILGSGGDGGGGLLLECAYSPDTSSGSYGSAAVAGKDGDMKRGGTLSTVQVALYKKFSFYEAMLKLGATLNGPMKKKNVDDSAAYRYESSTNSRLELIQRWNIAEAFYFDLILGSENLGEVQYQNEVTSAVTKSSSYSQGVMALGLGFSFFESVVLDTKIELDQLLQSVQITTGSTTMNMKTNSGKVASVGLSIYF
ncbi:hypothetical protein [Bdellovibrio svalbardensis]|uniref:Uncharacterized protein n=1 Tax=Bdellovibrio svalbardensis TaxID=2972972 RepID=A0ABT6DLV0_9BACT|nr:hypothetical protein [Bdellovibrio svalbardensis]MDG0817626.1 hypothetical protein [Bdellovibrio svalbardensis]